MVSKSTGIILDLKSPRGGTTAPTTQGDSSQYRHTVTPANLTWVLGPNRIWLPTYNGTTSLLTVTENVPLTANPPTRNVWDNGATFITWLNPTSDGEGNEGRIADKTGGGAAGWDIYVHSEAGGFVKIRFDQNFSTTIGSWDLTSAIVPIATLSFLAVSYNSSAVGNNPTIYLGTSTTLNILTVGAGLTESSTPVGTRVSDTGLNLIIGNRVGTDRTFEGTIPFPRIIKYVNIAGEILSTFNYEKGKFGF